jgi:hypothetical protein
MGGSNGKSFVKKKKTTASRPDGKPVKRRRNSELPGTRALDYSAGLSEYERESLAAEATLMYQKEQLKVRPSKIPKPPR